MPVRHSYVEVNLAIIQAKSAFENFPLFTGHIPRFQDKNDVGDVGALEICFPTVIWFLILKFFFTKL